MKLAYFIFISIQLSCTNRELVTCESFNTQIFNNIYKSLKIKEVKFNNRHIDNDSVLCEDYTDKFCLFLTERKLKTNENFVLSFVEEMGESYDAYFELTVDNIQYKYDFYPYPNDRNKIELLSKKKFSLEEAKNLSIFNFKNTPFNSDFFSKSKVSLYFDNKKIYAYYEY